MNDKLKIRIGASHVIAVLALALACGGTAFAGAIIGSEQIRNNSVQSVDIKNGSLDSRDVKDRSLGASDFSSDTRSALTNQWRTETSSVAVPGNTFGTATMFCDYAHGEVAVGGGGHSSREGGGQIMGSVPVVGRGVNTDKSIGWQVDMQNLYAGENFIVIRVDCVKG